MAAGAADKLARVPRIALNTGGSIPAVGLGTWQVTGSTCYDTVLAALRAGYRHLDSASVYRNEEEVGRALRDSGVPREDVFVTTKLQPRDHGTGAYAAGLRSLELLQLEYVDLYLVHWPGVSGMKLDDPAMRETRRETWEALQRLYDEKRCRAIGVSNFMPWHLEHMLTSPWCRIKPAVNQIELHPLLQQRDAVAASSTNGIVVEAYSSLARGAPELLEAGVMKAAAAAHGVTTSSVALRWALQKGYVVIPKSTNPARIASNIDLFGFTLTPREMADIDAMEESVKSMRTCWDPTTVKV